MCVFTVVCGCFTPQQQRWVVHKALKAWNIYYLDLYKKFPIPRLEQQIQAERLETIKGLQRILIHDQDRKYLSEPENDPVRA